MKELNYGTQNISLSKSIIPAVTFSSPGSQREADEPSLVRNEQMGDNGQLLSKHWDSFGTGGNYTDQIYSRGKES